MIEEGKNKKILFIFYYLAAKRKTYLETCHQEPNRFKVKWFCVRESYTIRKQNS